MKFMHHALVIVVFALPLSATVVGAEGFLDLYGGTVQTKTGHAEISGSGATLSGDVEHERSFTVGGRFGAWLPSFHYIGMGLDIFYFNTDEKDSDVKQKNLGYSLDIMGRVPLFTSDDIPHGRLQPYVTAGPAFFSSSLDIPGFTTATSTRLGYKLGAGLKFLVTKHIGFFAEYRYTNFQSKHDLQGNAFVVGNATVKQDLATNHFVGGLAIHF